MTSTLLWQEEFPLLRLEGSGARDFLQGQTSADLREIPEGELGLNPGGMSRSEGLNIIYMFEKPSGYIN